MSDFKKLLKPYQLAFLDHVMSSGLTPVVVGGAVRDFYRGLKEIIDFDVEIFGGEIKPLLENLSKFYPVEEQSFGVYCWKHKEGDVDFSLPRLEVYSDQKVYAHSDFKVKFIADKDFKTATQRRDLTINAMGFEWKGFDFTLLDPWSGLSDVQQGVIRAVDLDHFKKDPLRAYRAYRFCINMQFSLDKDLKKLLSEMNLEKLTPYHVLSEMLKCENPLLLLQSLPQKNQPSFVPKNLNLNLQWKRGGGKEALKEKLFMAGADLNEWKTLLGMTDREVDQWLRLSRLVLRAKTYLSWAQESFEAFQSKMTPDDFFNFHSLVLVLMERDELKIWMQEKAPALLTKKNPSFDLTTIKEADRGLYRVWLWLRS
jgi:tRNA nucleotidyltransferase/poly(A) polymerase